MIPPKKRAMGPEALPLAGQCAEADLWVRTGIVFPAHRAGCDLLSGQIELLSVF